MSWQTHPILIRFRNIARSLGLTRCAGKFLARKDYEERFSKALIDNIRVGDVVWDVGANVGFYSHQFSNSVGPDGLVYAVEPSMGTREILSGRVSDCSNVTIVDLALGAEEGESYFVEDSGVGGSTNRVVDTEAVSHAPGSATRVAVSTVDRLVEVQGFRIPNVIKIDTEGFELDVLKGMPKALKQKALRVVCVEIHFARLAERGMKTAPREIEMMLKASGFLVQWTDASHIVAVRK